MASVPKKYNRIKIILSLIELIISILFLIVLIWGQQSLVVARISRQAVANPYAQFLMFIGLIGIIHFVITFPFNFYSSFVLEHKFNLSNQNFWQWAWQHIKGLGVTVILGIPILLIFYFTLQNSPRFWWIWFGSVLFFFSILLARVAPVLLFPIFYKFSPLKEPELTRRFYNLFRKHGLTLQGLYRFDLSKDTRKANAAFTGLSRSKRIILADTLLENFTPDEIEYVVAHEVGHHHKKHLIKGIFMSTLSMFLGLFLVNTLYGTLLPEMGYNRLSDLEALPLLALLLMIYSLILLPLNNSLSRRYEFQADRFAVKETGRATDAVSTLKKLAELNLADESPHPLIEFIFYSHPSIHHRMQAIQKLEIGNESK